ncbi:MAG: V-type ATPase subunit [Thermoprotei archaeon]
MTIKAKSGQIARALPHVSYASLAPVVSSLRSTLLSQSLIDQLRKADLTAARSILENTFYGELSHEEVRSADEVYAITKRLISAAESRVLAYAPKRARQYLESYLSHWDAEEIKKEIASKAKASDVTSLRAYVESLPKPWTKVALSMNEYEKDQDPLHLTLAVDHIYLTQLISSFNSLADCERYELSGFIMPTLTWYALKTRLIADRYGSEIHLDIKMDDGLQRQLLSAIGERQFPDNLRAGDETYYDIVLGWARRQTHKNQFGPAPAQAVFMLKESEAKVVSAVLLEKLYGLTFNTG